MVYFSDHTPEMEGLTLNLITLLLCVVFLMCVVTKWRRNLMLFHQYEPKYKDITSSTVQYNPNSIIST